LRLLFWRTPHPPLPFVSQSFTGPRGDRPTGCLTTKKSPARGRADAPHRKRGEAICSTRHRCSPRIRQTSGRNQTAGTRFGGQLASSRPEEFHLRALPEPCMTLSSHTAPDVRPLLKRLCLAQGLLLFPVGQWPRPNNPAPFAPAPLQGLRRYYGLLRPCASLRYSRPRGWSRLRLAPSRRRRDEAQVLTFHTKAGRASRRLHAGCRSGSIRASPELIPEEGSPPGSDIA